MTRSTYTMRTTRRVGALTTGALLSLGMFAGPAGATGNDEPPSPEDNIRITYEDLQYEYITDGEPGEVRELGTVKVDKEYVGKDCDVRVISENEANPSVHPGNTLIVVSGGSSGEIADVEAAPGSVKTDILKNFTLGETIVLSLRLGEEGLSSLGFEVDFECTPGDLIEVEPGNQENPTTTTTTPSTTTPEATPAKPVAAQPTYTG